MSNEVGLKKIFVISPIHKPDESGFDFTKLTLDEIIKPAAKEAGGYATPLRADEIQSAGPITSRVIVEIVNADICIADLTGRNPNVMYEVAIAHAADKPVILLQQEEGGGPFDFADERVIHYGVRADLANNARRELVYHLRNTHRDENDALITSTLGPVRRIFKLMKSSTSAGTPEELLLNEIEKIKQILEQQTLAMHTALSSLPLSSNLPSWGKLFPLLYSECDMPHTQSRYDRLLDTPLDVGESLELALRRLAKQMSACTDKQQAEIKDGENAPQVSRAR
ncbi:hypothetical protein ABYF32_06095 [Buchananella felis]|uniref:hypothetical protein n=1 Tax=Buchananella felis TaxID=3231492 RepID=UPI0035272F9B